MKAFTFYGNGNLTECVAYTEDESVWFVAEIGGNSIFKTGKEPSVTSVVSHLTKYCDVGEQIFNAVDIRNGISSYDLKKVGR